MSAESFFIAKNLKESTTLEHDRVIQESAPLLLPPDEVTTTTLPQITNDCLTIDEDTNKLAQQNRANWSDRGAHGRGEESFRSYNGNSDVEKKMRKAIDHYIRGHSCEGKENKPLKVIIIDVRNQVSYGWEMFDVCEENGLCIRCNKCNEIAITADQIQIDTPAVYRMAQHAVNCKNTPLLKVIVADALGEDGDGLELDINNLGQEELKQRIIAMWDVSGNMQYFYVRRMIKKYCEYGKNERMNLTQLLYEKEYGIGEKYSNNYQAKIRRLAEMYTPEEAGPLRKCNNKK